MGNAILLSFLFILALFFLPTPQISAVDYKINVWPEPTNFSWTHPQATLISANFTIFTPSNSNPYLIRAVKRYLKQIHSEHYHPLVAPLLNLSSSTPLQALTITVADETAPLTHGVNECYSLSIPASHESCTATLEAETVWGAMRGLETFSQLVFGNPPRVASGLFISDQPLYPHRGAMLDTSRNYYAVEDLKRLIKGMNMNKLNVFHWHITDSHSFPLVVPSEPELAGKGAYGEEMKYSPEDVKFVVEYGMEHGVRVVPEIDMPGEFSGL